jgi:hypothetical protein
LDQQDVHDINKYQTRKRQRRNLASFLTSRMGEKTTTTKGMEERGGGGNAIEGERSEGLGDTITTLDDEFEKNVTTLCFYNGIANETIIVWNTVAWIYKARGAVIGQCPQDIVPVSVPSPTPAVPSSPTSSLETVLEITQPAIGPVDSYPACSPTVGDCISSFDQFVSLLDDDEANPLQDNDVIAICRDAVILTQDELVIGAQVNGITLCCESGPFECTIRQGDEAANSNLVVFGRDFTLRGINFMEGVEQNFSGGSVSIDNSNGLGTTTIDQCSFIDGASGEGGGNLFVRNVKSLVITNSLFIGGNDVKGGGNVAIIDTGNVELRNNRFETGASNVGGNLFIQTIDTASIIGNVFDQGTSQSGAGAFISDIASVIIISDNTFTNNVASTVAAGLYIRDFDVVELSVTLSNNRGENNAAPNCTDILLLPTDDASDPQCLDFASIESTNAPVSGPITSPTTSSAAPVVEVQSPTIRPVSPVSPVSPVASPTASGPTLIIADFYIALASPNTEQEPTQTAIDALIVATELYLRSEFNSYFQNPNGEVLAVDMELSGFGFNDPSLLPPDTGDEFNIYLQFPLATFTYPVGSVPPSLVVAVLLMNSILVRPNYIIGVVQQITEFSTVQNVKFGAVTFE